MQYSLRTPPVIFPVSYISRPVRRKVNHSTLEFLDASTALLRIHSDAGKELSLTASQWGKEIQVQTDQNTVIARHPSGEIVALTFTPDVSVKGTDNNYQAKSMAANTTPT